MPSLTGIDIASLATLALAQVDSFPQNQVVETLPYSDFPLFERMNAIARPHQGKNLNYTVRYKEREAQSNSPYQPDTVTVEDFVVNGTQVMVSGKQSWTINNLEDELNGGEDAVFDIVMERRLECYISVIKQIEDQLLGVPQSSTDTTKMMGIPAQVCTLASGISAAGFTGTTLRYRGGTTSTTINGIDRASTDPDYSRIPNWADLHSGNVDNNFFQSALTAMMKTSFAPPSILPAGGGPFNASKSRLAVFPTSMATKYKRYLQSLGANYNVPGGVMADLAGVTVVTAQALDKTSTSDTDVVRAYEPCFFLNTDPTRLRFYNLRNMWLKETKPAVKSDDHNTLIGWVDWTAQLQVRDARSQFVLHTQV